MSVMLTRMEEAMMPKNMHLETGAEVKPEASMFVNCWLAINMSEIRAAGGIGHHWFINKWLVMRA